MNPHLRNVLATLAGLVAGSVVNMGLVLLNVSLFPMPAGASFEDPAAMAAWTATLPASAFLLVLAAHGAQAFVGGALATRLAATRGPVPAGLIATLTALGSAANMVQLPAPAWMWVDVPLNLALGWGAWRLARRAD